MDGYRAFEMKTDPYIPEQHLGYDLLPDLTASGGEVFSYPAELNEVDSMVIECENPVYEGVVDNEEFTSYMYPCDKDSWEIVEDPTGMAARALAGDADTIGVWRITPDMIVRGPSVRRGAREGLGMFLQQGECAPLPRHV